MSLTLHHKPIESFKRAGERTWDNAWERAQQWASGIHNALSAAEHQSFFNEYYGATIAFRPKVYEFARPLRLGASMRLAGAGALYGTILYFPASDGIIAEFDTTDMDGDGKKPIGQETVLENLHVRGEIAADTDYDGIRMHTNIIVRDCRIGGFSRDGIHIEADLSCDPGSACYGNANSWFLENIAIAHCGRHGLFVNGGDANAGTAVALKVIGNGYTTVRPLEKDAAGGGRYGIFESSFLGNTYVGCQVEGCENGGIKVEGGSNYSVFLGCYVELDSPCDIRYPAIWVGRGFPNSSGGAPPVVLSSDGFQNQVGVQTFQQLPEEKAAEQALDAKLYDEGTPPFSEELVAGKGVSTYLGRDYDEILWLLPREWRLRYSKVLGQRPTKIPSYAELSGETPFSLRFDFGPRRRYDLRTLAGGAVLSFKHEPSNDEKLYFPRGFHVGFGGTADRFVRVCSYPEPPNWDASVYVWEPGDVVLNSQPSRNKPYAGWIYTAEGWKPYGKIEF